MFKKTVGLWRGLTLLFAVLLMVSITTRTVMEDHKSELDSQLGTVSSKTVTLDVEVACPKCGEKTSRAVCPVAGCNTPIPGTEDLWTYEQEWDTAKKAYDGLKEISIRQAQESVVLLKNTSNALPIAQNAKITLLGARSYAPQYGGHAASIPDAKSTEGNQIFEAFAARGFQINPSMLQTYKNYFSTLTWATSRPSGNQPHYANMNTYTNIVEFNRDELAQLNPNYASEFSTYKDAAIVVLGRPSQEGGSGFRPSTTGMSASTATYLTGMTDTETDNILGISNEERDILNLAKANFSKVIVLINSASQMEIESLKKDTDIDAIAWIGLPGSYGFLGIADVLNGTVSPSGHLGDTYAVNSYITPAMVNHGGGTIGSGATAIKDGTGWDVSEANYGSVSGLNIHDYLVQAESIYAGYRYYETRYADTVYNKGNAKIAKAGTWTNNYKPATTDGTWNYNNEVSYAFGYGSSYTTFEQTLDRVNVLGNRKTAEVTVTVKNTGTKPGKSVVQLYAQAPYTQYDINNLVEKSAIQLLDYEKTNTLEPNGTQTIIIEVDLANLASYDYKNAKTFILDPGDYYFAIGDSAHDALNNVLTAQGYSTTAGMTYAGKANKTYKWTISGSNADKIFAASKAGVEVTNRLSEGIYAMDFNAFRPGTIKYLTRNDWNGSYPIKYSGLKPTEEMRGIMLNDFVPISTNDDVSDIKFEDTASTLTINEMKGASYDDERWDELLNKLKVQEFLNFAARSFHNIEAMPSVGLLGSFADDGPLGSDSRHLGQGAFRRQAFSDAAEYTGYFTRVAPSPMNLAYTWNKELAYENGQKVLGEVSLMMQAPIMIGPGMNIHRHAYNSRGHEYYSEDPVLSGFTGSAVTQGAQSKGCVVNIKHFAFNDQEIQRDGVATFMTEQKARELELRNFQQAIEGNGQPASFKGTDKEYGVGALGVMLSYSRIGAVAAGANKAAVLDILRGEWGFRGYSVTDYSSVSIKAAPKEAVLYGTSAFCGNSANANVTNHPSYTVNTSGAAGTGWTTAAFSNDRQMLLAFKQATHYNLYALANSHAMNGVNASSYTEDLMTWWRALYITLISVTSGLTFISAALFITTKFMSRKEVA